MVPFSAYRFLVATNLHKLSPEEINFLEFKRCLHVPSRTYLDEFCHQYFRCVHPFLPVVNEAAFWRAYHGDHDFENLCDSSPRFPLIVLQAMLFTSCSFVRLETLNILGFASVKEARRAMYERAKMLHNIGTERSRLHLAQSALLLSHWTPSFEEITTTRPNMAWLRIAIENARLIRAHQWKTAAVETQRQQEQPEPPDDACFRRLWACCIVRDCTAAISLRRCCQMTTSDTVSDKMLPLIFDDLMVEVHRSRVYDPVTKTKLIETFLELTDMCTHLTDISALLFPPEDGIPKSPKPNFQMQGIARITDCKTTLDDWHANTIQSGPSNINASPPGEGAGIHSSVTFFISLRNIYF